MMMCDECGVNPAEIRLVTIVNGEKKERNICRSCMMEMRKQLPGLDLPGFDLETVLRSVGATDGGEQDQEIEKLGFAGEESYDIVCFQCGTTYDDFREAGLLGCASCYRAFREPLDGVLKRIHGQTQHIGRVPVSPDENVTVKMQIERLRQELSVAISQEEYEQAAALRDKIRLLKSEIGEAEENA